MSELRFHRAARVELVEAAVYYEDRREGFGAKFEGELDEVVARIREFPNAGSLLPGYPPEFEVRAFHFKTFRHSLLVATVDGIRTVCAAAHQQRRPGYWKNRLR